MLDTTPVTTAIRELISAGVAEDELDAHVPREFPHLTIAKLSQALQQVDSIDARRCGWGCWHGYARCCDGEGACG